MNRDVVTRIVPAEGFRSAQVAAYVAELEELRERIVLATMALSPEQLMWQPRPGMNTVGMLLAHIAVAETHVGQGGLHGERDGHVQDVIGIAADDDGLPLSAGAPPSPALNGRDSAFFAGLLARASAHTRAAAAALSDADLDREVVRPPRPDGSRRIFNLRWVLYHMIEHTAGHFGQVQLLVHLMRDSGV